MVLPVCRRFAMAGNHKPSVAQRLIGGAALAVVAGLSIYFAATYSGPYRWFAELQLKWMGAYEEQITFILSLAVTAAPLGLMVWAWKKGQRVAGGDVVETAGSTSARGAVVTPAD